MTEIEEDTCLSFMLSFMPNIESIFELFINFRIIFIDSRVIYVNYRVIYVNSSRHLCHIISFSSILEEFIEF